MRDLNEANVIGALAEVGGPPAILTCAPGVPELIARRICQAGKTPVYEGEQIVGFEESEPCVAGIEVCVDPWAAGWKLERVDG